jgi:hypothetical protein
MPSPFTTAVGSPTFYTDSERAAIFLVLQKHLEFHVAMVNYPELLLSLSVRRQNSLMQSLEMSPRRRFLYSVTLQLSVRRQFDVEQLLQVSERR